MEESSFHNNESQEKQKIISVEQGEWECIEPGMVGKTTNLGPCFGVIVYDEQSKTAFVGHFPDPRIGLEDMIAEAKKRIQDLGHTKTYLGGASLNMDDAPSFENDKAKRSFVKEKLSEAGLNDVSIKYQTSLETTVMKIDTNTGQVEYDTWQSFFPKDSVEDEG